MYVCCVRMRRGRYRSYTFKLQIGRARTYEVLCYNINQVRGYALRTASWVDRYRRVRTTQGALNEVHTRHKTHFTPCYPTPSHPQVLNKNSNSQALHLISSNQSAPSPTHLPDQPLDTRTGHDRWSIKLIVASRVHHEISLRIHTNTIDPRLDES